ncbi:MAG: DsrE/DsrF/DrsH-like family protein [Chloroflexi bacterium]|nr:DsrE/DsrF/DrsH-like family protein [Chloroflexota bacterium]
MTTIAVPYAAPLGSQQLEEEATQPKKLSMVVFSGDMDKALAAFVIATGAAASGAQVTMFFTFWGLKLVQRGKLAGRSLFGRMMGAMNRGGVEAVGPSRFNFLGVGRWLFKRMMKSHNVSSLAELRQMAADLGVRMIACQMSMDVMEIPREDLIPEVADVVGVATFIEQAQQSQTTLFI